MNFRKRRHGYTVNEYNANNSTAYNCHSFAWEETYGDQLDPRNEYPVSLGAYRWDNNPDNMAGFEQLDKNEPNKKKIVYCIMSILTITEGMTRAKSSSIPLLFGKSTEMATQK